MIEFSLFALHFVSYSFDKAMSDDNELLLEQLLTKLTPTAVILRAKQFKKEQQEIYRQNKMNQANKTCCCQCAISFKDPNMHLIQCHACHGFVCSECREPASIQDKQKSDTHFASKRMVSVCRSHLSIFD